ncbi:saccharopine dehydrogenase family protein [Pseudoalteromonas sp. ASV78]|uniref:saccharopine dehydrogenase family protein n=1 Tax=Pseudoalteromonas sp. ASV78 TaxID=3397851 RepID=UPI0039FCA7B2
MNTLMIYGASGYTGRMATEYAKAAGLNVIAAGRDEAKITQLAAEQEGISTRVFSLDDEKVIDQALADVSVILNCAGPYHRTAKALMHASLRTGCHYLDMAAELDSYQLAEQLDAKAKAAGVMLLPGSGGSVAMLGCLAGFAAEQIAQPRKVSIALHVTGSMSRGSAISASENLSHSVQCRRDGKLVDQNPRAMTDFDFGAGAVPCFPVTLPDLISIWHATQIPDIETFVHLSGNAFPEGDLQALPDGPDAAERAANRYQAAVYITDQQGRVSRAVLDTVNGYTFTPLAAVEAARRALNDELSPGFQTPAGLFGHQFATFIADTRMTLC